MNQTCKVCGEPAAGFHFGAFTCEGCKSFFGRSYNNLPSINECKNNGKCIIDKKNRTTCKACRLRKCYNVGMSKGGSRYGRRSNWFKIHCLLQEQQQQAAEAAQNAGNGRALDYDSMNAALVAQQHNQQLAMQHMNGLLGYHGYLPDMMQNPSPFMTAAAAAAARHSADALPFFNMISTLPNMGSTQPAFPLPPHLIFPNYHPMSTDATYSAELNKHRQSVDSSISGKSSPAANAHSADQSPREPSNLVPQPARSVSPELCVSGEDDEVAANANPQSSGPSPASNTHIIHSPIPVRAMPLNASPKLSAPVPTTTMAEQIHAQQARLPSPISTASNYSGNGELSIDIGDQDSPIDLSMKSSHGSVCSRNSVTGESDTHSDLSEEDRQHQSLRRNLYSLGAGASSSDHDSDASSDVSGAQGVKRPKLAEYDGFVRRACGIFVCV